MLVMFATENLFSDADVGYCMKIVKSIAIVLGIAAGSSIFLVLSGSAFAAGSGPGTTSQTAAPTEAVKQVSTVATTAVVTAAETTVDDKAQVSKLLGTVNLTNEQEVKIPSGTIWVSDNNSRRTSSISKLEAPNPAVNVSFKNATEERAAPANDGKTTRPVPEAAAASLEAELTLTAVAPSVISQSEHRVMFNSVALAIQPRITTSHQTEVADLAAMVPSAPEQREHSTQHPVPTQSSGVFNRLTATLAGTIVPSFVYTPTSGVIGIKIGLIVFLIVISILARRTFYSFSNWTRRGGFAHAARSDVASAMFNSFSATPLNLSFVTAQPSLQSSFFDGVRYENCTINDHNALRKEE